MSMKKQKRFKLKATIRDKRGKILSIGFNSYVKTHPTQYHYAKKMGKPDAVFLHAEISALVKCKDLKNAYSIHVERYSKKTGRPLLAKPCPICMEAIKQAGITHVKYTRMLREH